MAFMEIAVEPIGGDAHMHELVARCLDVIRESGLEHQIGPMGTVVKGLPDDLYQLAARVHRAAIESELAPRIIVNIRVDQNTLGEHSLPDLVRLVEHLHE